MERYPTPDNLELEGMERVLAALPHSLPGHDNGEAPTLVSYIDTPHGLLVMPIHTGEYELFEHVIDLHADNFCSMAGLFDRQSWGNTIKVGVESFRPIRDGEKVHLVYDRALQPHHPDPDIVRDLIVFLVGDDHQIIRRYTASFCTHRSIAMIWASLSSKTHPRLLGTLPQSWKVVNDALTRLDRRGTDDDAMAGQFFRLAHGDRYDEFRTRMRESSNSPRDFIRHLDGLLHGALLFTRDRGYGDIPEELRAFSPVVESYVDAMLRVFSGDDLDAGLARALSPELTREIIQPLDEIQNGTHGEEVQRVLEEHKVQNSGTLYYAQLLARAVVSLGDSKWRQGIVG